MANSFTGINETVILQDVFQAFKDALTPVSGFSTSYDAEARKRGEKISVPVATARSAASRSDGATYEVATGNTVAVADVTLNQQYHVPWYVTDGESAKTLVDLWTSGMRESATALAKSIYQSLLGVFVKATYGDVAGTSKLVQAASGFDLDDLVDLDTYLTARGAYGPRTFLCTLSYGNALKKDNAIQDASAFGSDAVLRSGRFGVPMYGITAYETNAFPAGITGGSELTGGILAVPSAAAIAIRPVEPLDTSKLLNFEVVSDPDSGLSMGYRRWYNETTGTMWGTMEALWGVIAVQSAGAVRVCTA
jgi:hypothetical protein